MAVDLHTHSRISDGSEPPNRIIELGDKKERVTKEDLPFIIADVLGQHSEREDIEVINYSLSLTQGLSPVATVRLRIKGEFYQETSTGDGQYNAFVRALWEIYAKLGKEHPTLEDYSVHIPPGGHTDALVEATTVWDFKGKKFKTRGLDADQTEAAIQATIKMLNLIEEA